MTTVALTPRSPPPTPSLTEVIEEVHRNPTESTLSLINGSFDHDSALALKNLLADEAGRFSSTRGWVLSFSCITVKRDDHEQETMQALRDAFSNTIDRIHLDHMRSQMPHHMSFLIALLSPTSMDNAKAMSSMFVSNCTFTEQAANVVNNYLQHATSLYSLFYTYSTYESGRAVDFLNVIFRHEDGSKMENPKYVGLYRSKIDDEQAQQVVDVLRRRVNVEQLVFSHNPISVLPNLSELNHLKSLSIGSLTAKLEAGTQLVDAIRGCDSLEEISLSSNVLDDSHIETLFEYLQGHRTIRRLNLRNTSLSERGLKAIVKYLRSNSSLLSLELIGNDISDAVYHELGDVLETNNDTMQDLRTANIYSTFPPNDGRYRIEALNVRNWAGRKLLKRLDEVPPGIWPHVLVRIQDRGNTPYFTKELKKKVYTADSMYHFLRGGLIG